MPIQSFEEKTLDRLNKLEDRFNTFIGQDRAGSTRFASGGVIFGAGTTLPPTTDAANFFWDNTNKRLGIGTNSPSAPIHTQVSTGLGGLFKTTGADSDASIQINNDARSWALRVLGSNADIFQIYDVTAAGARVSIDTNGYVYIPQRATIGSTNAPSRPFTVDAGAAAAFASFNASGVEKWVIGSDTTASHIFIFYNPTNAYAGIITQSNFWRFGDGTTPSYRVELPNVASTSGQGRANSWVTYSSRSLKRNIRAIDMRALRQRIKDIRLVNFEWDNAASGAGVEIGMIAEELYPILPELVTGDISKPDTLGIKESKAGLIALAMVLHHMSETGNPNG